jgi:hypothetical protein
LGCLKKGLGEASTGHCHREGGAAGSVLSLDDLVATKLHAVHVVLQFLAVKVLSRLREKGNDGRAGVATDNRDALVSRIGALDLANEAAGADDIEGSDSEQTLRVVDALGLEDLGGDWDGGVDLRDL